MPVSAHFFVWPCTSSLFLYILCNGCKRKGRDLLVDYLHLKRYKGFRQLAEIRSAIICCDNVFIASPPVSFRLFCPFLYCYYYYDEVLWVYPPMLLNSIIFTLIVIDLCEVQIVSYLTFNFSALYQLIYFFYSTSCSYFPFSLHSKELLAFCT